MKWDNCGPTLTDDALARFEAQSGRKVPNAIRWFLTNECNGGWPGGQYFLPVEDSGEEYECLHGVYGIDDPGHDLLSSIKSWPEYRKEMWPIGYDDFSGKFVLMLEGPYRGQVRFMPRDYFVDPENNDHFFVAKNIKAFSEMLKNPSLPEIED